MPLIERLTPEQEALIPTYRKKWCKIALSTEPIDRQKTAEAINAVYTLIGQNKQPEILFFDSPLAALSLVFSGALSKEMGLDLSGLIRNQLLCELPNQFLSQVDHHLWNQLENQFSTDLWINLLRDELLSQLDSQLRSDDDRYDFYYESELWNQWRDELIDKAIFNCIEPEVWASTRASLYGFCISVLNCDRNQKLWSAYQLLLENCGWIFPHTKICLVCDRPRFVCFDNQQRLHAEGSPALQFADQFSVYAHHGVRIPERYGRVPSKEWQSEWLLSEKNAELRRVLIQGIGYAKIYQELQAIKLDTWNGYTLLKINSDVDVDPIYLLKMTCPSTGYVHVLRVPPDIHSAREAITWVNWGIAPEKFAVQT
jgi:hypothetical protein